MIKMTNGDEEKKKGGYLTTEGEHFSREIDVLDTKLEAYLEKAADLKNKENDLDARDEILTQREIDLNNLESRLTSDRRVLDKEKGTFKDYSSDLAKREDKLKRDYSKLETEKTNLEKRREDLTKARESLEEEKDALYLQEQEIIKRDEDLTEREQSSDQIAKDLKKDKEDMDRRITRLDRTEGAYQRRDEVFKKTVESHKKDVKQFEDYRSKEIERIDKDKAELAGKKEDIERLQQQVELDVELIDVRKNKVEQEENALKSDRWFRESLEKYLLPRLKAGIDNKDLPEWQIDQLKILLDVYSSPIRIGSREAADREAKEALENIVGGIGKRAIAEGREDVEKLAKTVGTVYGAPEPTPTEQENIEDQVKEDMDDYLKESGLDIEENKEEPAEEEEDQVEFACPLCNAKVEEGALECPECGTGFAQSD
jgi:chromosome segregation ATPase